jgi:hypothetical protein
VQDIVASLLGAGFVSIGVLLKYVLDKPKQQNKDTTFTNMTFAGEILCGHVETVPTEDDDPWSYLLEPCDNPALVIMGGLTLCEDHRDSYLLEMSPNK